MLDIVLLPLHASLGLEEVLDATAAETILVADCYVTGAETWTAKPWGWELVTGGRRVINVDHHAADSRFYRNVSSGNLAAEYMRQRGTAGGGVVVINHTDCDSFITAILLAGLIKPEPRYEEAVIAADHTGAANAIADLLQSLDDLRDLGCSLRNLRLLEKGRPVEPAVEHLLSDRLAERERARKLVSGGAYQRVGRVYEATLTASQRVSGEFLPPLLPDAWAIVSGSPMQDGKWETKIRLGSAATEGASLFSLGVLEAEPLFGGRWNAGSTKRAGGSFARPDEVAQRLARFIETAARLE